MFLQVSCPRAINPETSTHGTHSASWTFNTKYITGLGTVDERMLILLDIEKLMTGTDMALVETSLH